MTKKKDPSQLQRAPRATKAEMAQRLADKKANAAQKVHTSMMPGIVAERQRMYAERLAALGQEVAAAGTPRICNAAMREPYRTGDGEVVQQVRPGSMTAYGLPSRGNAT